MDSEPIIGNNYLVPSVIMGQHLIPIFGPIHHDKEIGFDKIHAHIDERFVSNKMKKMFSSFIKNISVVTFKETPKIHYATFQCVRTFSKRKKSIKVIQQLEKVMEGKKLNCDKCPHKGMSLTQIPVDTDGNVVCPGHALKWNKKSGELVKYASQKG